MVYKVDKVPGPIPGAAPSLAPFRGMPYRFQRFFLALSLRGRTLQVDKAFRIMAPWRYLSFEPFLEWLFWQRRATWRDMENHPVWDIDKKYKPLKGAAKYSHLYGWPAPPDEKIQLITNSYIIPNMFARVVTNTSKPKEAMVWAETEIKRAFERG